MQKLRLKPDLGEKSNQSATRTRAGLREIPNLLTIPELPISHIFSYLSFKDMKTCSTVSKCLRRLVFPLVIKSSFIRLKDKDQIPAMIDFIKSVSNNFKKNVNLSMESEMFEVEVFSDNSDDSSDESESLDDYREPSTEDNRSTLLQFFRECGSNINSLKLTYNMDNPYHEIVCGLRDDNCLPVLGIGNELFPNLKRLEIMIFMEVESLNGATIQDVVNALLAFVKAVLRNSPTLKELKVEDHNNDVVAPSLFKLIGESELRIDTLEIEETHIEDDDLINLQSLNLKKLIILGFLFLENSQSLTDFLESQSATLTYLHLEKPFNSFLRDFCLPHFAFPRMELLETCKLLDTYKLPLRETDDDDVEELTPISYQVQLPKLKKLELQHVKKDHFLTFFPSDANPRTSSVYELRILLGRLQQPIFIRSTGAFEALTKLEIPVASYLNDSWKDLTTLEELTLYPKSWREFGSENSQENITWIDKIITGLYLSCSDLSWERDIRSHEEKYEKMEPKKSLALLTRLRLLRLRHGVLYSPGPRLLLSDVSCKVVLMKMESLKCIDFCGIHPSCVGASRKVLDEMGKKMDLIFGETIRERNWNYY